MLVVRIWKTISKKQSVKARSINNFVLFFSTSRKPIKDPKNPPMPCPLKVLFKYPALYKKTSKNEQNQKKLKKIYTLCTIYICHEFCISEHFCDFALKRRNMARLPSHAYFSLFSSFFSNFGKHIKN